MKVLITGSSGTIGTRLMETLLSEGFEVIGVDKVKNKWITSLNKKIVIADLSKKENLSLLPKNVDIVIHFAANARVYELVKNPDMAMENIAVTYNVLEYMRQNKIEKIIFSSSRETYGNLLKDSKITEDQVRLENCESPYSASKIAGEVLIESYNKCFGIEFVIARFSNVYGMYDDSDRVIPLWIKQMRRNEGIVVFGKDKVLDFTYIDDTVLGIIKILNNFDKLKGETFNLAYGKGIKIIDVANSLKKLLTSTSNVKIEGNRTGEVWKFEADISKANKLFGFSPKVSFEEGLRRTVEWYSRN